MRYVGVLVPDSPEAPRTSPRAWPMGRGALQALERGVGAVFGERVDDQGRLDGLLATHAGWEPACVEVGAVFDRFRDQLYPARYARVRRHLRAPTWANAPSVIALCRDKVASQRALEEGGVSMPRLVETDLEQHLSTFGTGFLKPRYGSFGRGVRRVVPGDVLPRHGEAMRSGDLQPMVLQEAVPPPSPYAGVCVRALVQWVEGGWQCRTPVARADMRSPVVNVARGAKVAPALQVFGAQVDDALRAAAVQVAEVVATWGTTVEVGVDLVVGPDRRVVVIEVNGRPRGRLAALAEQGETWMAEHVASCAAPMIAVAQLAED
jgi:glutathione synthase/RimK-type ligase-like ATP-grasp enzyme